MNVSLRQAACPFVVLFGSATLLFAQAVQPAQPRATQPRVQPGTVTQQAQPAQPGRFAQPGQPAQPGRIIGQPGQPGAQGQLEPSIITLLIIDNNKEIALAKLGQQHAQNEDIKHFCHMIEEDHSNFVQKLQEQSGAGGRAPRIGAAPGSAQPGQPLREGSREPGAQVREGADQARDATRDLAGQTRDAAQPREGSQPRDTAQPREGATVQRDQQAGQRGERITLAKPVIGNQPGAQILALQQELAEACLESVRKDAEKARPEEFAKLFMAAQVIGHKGMLDKLQVFERHVSPRTAQLLSDAQETTRKHLQEAESIWEQLDKQGSGDRDAAIERRTERREGTERRPADRPDRPREEQ